MRILLFTLLGSLLSCDGDSRVENAHWQTRKSILIQRGTECLQVPWGTISGDGASHRRSKRTVVERKSLQSLGFLPVLSPSLGLHLLRTVRQPGNHWSYWGWRAEELKAIWKQKPAVPPVQGFPQQLPTVCPTPWTKKTRLGGGPASQLLRLHA